MPTARQLGASEDQSDANTYSTATTLSLGLISTPSGRSSFTQDGYAEQAVRFSDPHFFTHTRPPTGKSFSYLMKLTSYDKSWHEEITFRTSRPVQHACTAFEICARSHLLRQSHGNPALFSIEIFCKGRAGKLTLVSKNYRCAHCHQDMTMDLGSSIEDVACRGNVCSRCASFVLKCMDCGKIVSPYSDYPDRCPACMHIPPHFVCRQCGSPIIGPYYRHMRTGFAKQFLCHHCHERLSRNILPWGLHSYHAGKRQTFLFYPTSNLPLYLGVELEIDSFETSEIPRVVDSLRSPSNENALFWLECDSSLRNGIEIISMPATLEYHQNDFPWQSIISIASHHGGKGSARCGLHVHFSKNPYLTQDNSYRNLARLVYLCGALHPVICYLFRRPTAIANRYAIKPTIPTGVLTNMTPSANSSFLHFLGERHSAVTTAYPPTIELRMFRGTVDVTEFYAQVEFASAIFQLALKVDTHTLSELSVEAILNDIAQVHMNFQNYLSNPRVFKRVEPLLPKKVRELYGQNLGVSRVRVESRRLRQS